MNSKYCKQYGLSRKTPKQAHPYWQHESMERPYSHADNLEVLRSENADSEFFSKVFRLLLLLSIIKANNWKQLNSNVKLSAYLKGSQDILI